MVIHEAHELLPPTRNPTNESSSPSQPSAGSQRRSTAFLDGLRGLAALFVFQQHFFGGFTATAPHERGFGQDGKHWLFASLPFLRVLWSGGHAAVVVFFILSGYVLSVGPLHKIRGGQIASAKAGLIGAVVRRPIRLYLPVLAVSFVFALLLHVPGPLVMPLPWNGPKESVFLELVEFVKISVVYFNPFQVHGSDKYWYPYNISVWTIPIELKGSALIYAILFICACTFTSPSDDRRPALGTAFLFGAGFTMLQLGFKWSGAAFTFGVVLALIDTYALDTTYLLSRFPKRFHTSFFTTCFIAGWYLLSQPSFAGDLTYSSHTPGWVFLSSLIPSVYGKDHYYRYWQTWGAFFLIYATLRLPPVQHFFSSRPLKYLGKVSFMLYLIHLPFFRIFPDRLKKMLGEPLPFPWEEHYEEMMAHVNSQPPKVKGFWDDLLWIPDIGPVGLNSRFLVAMFITLPMALVLAEWATRYIDTPSVKLGKRVSAMLGLEGKSESRKEVLPT